MTEALPVAVPKSLTGKQLAPCTPTVTLLASRRQLLSGRIWLSSGGKQEILSYIEIETTYRRREFSGVAAWLAAELAAFVAVAAWADAGIWADGEACAAAAGARPASINTGPSTLGTVSPAGVALALACSWARR